MIKGYVVYDDLDAEIFTLITDFEMGFEEYIIKCKNSLEEWEIFRGTSYADFADALNESFADDLEACGKIGGHIELLTWEGTY